MKRQLTARNSITALLLAGTLLAGCSSGHTGGAGGKTVTESAPASTAALSKPVKLDIIENASGLPTPDKDFIKQELDKALNTDINLTAYAAGDDYKNQLNVRVASGNFPDLFGVDKSQLKQFAQQGLLLDLTPYLDKELKSVKDFIGADSLKKGTVDGKIYAIAKAPQIPYNTYWIRKDWLDKLNLKAPTTFDELLNVSKAFTEQDPDGNGKKDTYGLTGGKLQAFAPVFGGYGVGNPYISGGAGEFYVKDGKIVNSLYDSGMKDALAFINKFIASGSADPELMANNGLQHQEKAIKGQAGIVWLDWPNVTKEQFADQIKKVNPNAEWLQMAAPKGPVAQNDGSWDIGTAPGLFVIPKSVEKDKAKLQKVFDLLNYVSTKDGSLLVQFGVKSKHFNLEGDKVIPTDLMGKEAGYTWLYQFTGRPEQAYLSVKFAPQVKYIDFANKQPRIQVLNGFLTYPDGYNAADASRFVEEEITKFVYGKRPLSEYDGFLKSLETTMNYKTYMDSAIKQLQTLGYSK
ncbi:extracellular solute-binding protein [Paenibacillus roseipurpureus]|uniref:Extracellular solute-binding protein n=1 Tax=Paenibacillus roseopurpureus TaxID=2918901 RepID=A0AA96LVM6_9BACL|nr:extracellular solute-binding protein [Paenibacillus sp. MBLB1832]WNR46914.1 extracellular solute-binding protein [Paenibacillus sp. MBLB1832]